MKNALAFRIAIVGTTVVALALQASAAGAQGPRGSDKLSAAEVADSLAVLRMLDSALNKSPNDAAAWNRRGMIAWSLATRAQTPPPIRDIEWTSLQHMADTSLRLAAAIEPQNVYYRLAVGRHLASTFGPLNRTAASVANDATVAMARTLPDRAQYADAALEAGEIYWRFYDSKEVINTSSNTSGPIMVGGATGDPLSAVSLDEIRRVTAHPDISADFSGEDAYLHAQGLFREALDAAPENPRAFRSLAAVYGARSRWTELAALARDRTRTAPWDPWAWMALGLATHRLGNTKVPPVAFDSAMTLFSDSERHRLDRIGRIMKPSDSLLFAKLNDADRFATERLFWLTANPLWSGEVNAPRLEFLARITYAELRWTYDELDVRGADTDRGMTYIRYGPPMMASTSPPTTDGTVLDFQTTWRYASGLIFVFHGFDRFVFSDIDWVEKVTNEAPVFWNTSGAFHVDSMPVQVARFRARDSVDVLLAVKSPLAAIAKASDVAGPVRSHLWLLAGGTITVAHDSLTLGAASPPTSTYVRRVGHSNYVYRTEASEVGSRIAGRATGVVVTNDDPGTGFRSTGVGMSDVLVATRAESGTATPARWSDIDVAPLAGEIATRSQVSVIWEAYELGQQNGNARYSVSVTLRRDRRERLASGRIVARIASGIAGSVGVHETADEVALTFDRTVRYAPTLVENLALSLGNTPAGAYVLTVKVTDQVTGREMTSSRDMVIADPPSTGTRR